MTELESGNGQTLQNFVNTGRTGRRNALADVLDAQHAAVGTGEVTFDMSKLKCPSEEDESKKSDQACANPQDRNGEAKQT